MVVEGGVISYRVRLFFAEIVMNNTFFKGVVVVVVVCLLLFETNDKKREEFFNKKKTRVRKIPHIIRCHQFRLPTHTFVYAG